MTAMPQRLSRYAGSSLVKIVLVLASVVSVLALYIGLVFYPLFDLVFSNLVPCLFLVATGVWLGTNDRVDAWLGLAIGNGAILVGLCLWVLMGITGDSPFVGPVFLTAAALFVTGYSTLGGWLIRRAVSLMGWRL